MRDQHFGYPHSCTGSRTKARPITVPLFTLALVESIHAASICNALTPNSWTQAASSNPKLQGALNELSKNAVATWYTDRGGDAISDLLQKCSGSQVPSIVIYGLPKKDCADGFSSSGNNKDAAMYKTQTAPRALGANVRLGH
ncbi:hypothetical protein H257_19391 [Aphanomyces astaci]|uniref:Uncharacterized protein n=1 Tax=Aphanomyces astaci TaxID=112090 RepID=W4FA39_APHAT|nr:hypothetical protein H257_19391 [Aphanomyces astaci]ETV63676.1 hypothetical protein H257_19391 [Aphanomyces astaci]|eukprot:XP_009846840.1 hypothetical protein H257_19391 [Aphanomyces astaci]